MKKNEIFKNLLNNIDEVYETVNDEYPYIYADIEREVINHFNDEIIRSIEESSESLDELIKRNPDFFENSINTIYLKLSNLYKKLPESDKEKQELYYVVDKFAPVDSESVKRLNEEIVSIWLENKETYDNVLKKVIEDVLVNYKEVIEYGKEQEKNEKVDKTIKVLDDAVNDFETGNYEVLNLLDSNADKEEISEFVIDKNIDIAYIYTKHKGNELTPEEKRIVLSELDQKQNEILSEVNVGRKL